MRASIAFGAHIMICKSLRRGIFTSGLVVMMLDASQTAWAQASDQPELAVPDTQQGPIEPNFPRQPRQPLQIAADPFPPPPPPPPPPHLPPPPPPEPEKPHNWYVLHPGIFPEAVTFAGLMQFGLAQSTAKDFYGILQFAPYKSEAGTFVGLAQVGLGVTEAKESF